MAFIIDYDGLGSVAALSDSSGNMVEKYEYDVFGSFIATVLGTPYGEFTESTENPYYFTARRYDPETGNYYYRARYYSPATGRFLQTDPISVAGGINLYTYCFNNPINFIDPSGKWLETAWDVANVGMGVVSLVSNVKKGNYGWATLDAVGVIYDTVATAVPFLPGAAGAAYKAARAGNTAVDSINVGMDVMKITDATHDAARTVDTVSDAATYGKNVHNTFQKAKFKTLENFAPMGKANRATGIKPDFVGNGIWADITTSGQWQRHISKYADGFGEAVPIIYQRGKGVNNMLHTGAGIGLTGAQQIIGSRK